MSNITYKFLEEEYDLQLFNTDIGEQLTENRDPEAVFMFYLI